MAASVLAEECNTHQNFGTNLIQTSAKILQASKNVFSSIDNAKFYNFLLHICLNNIKITFGLLYLSIVKSEDKTKSPKVHHGDIWFFECVCVWRNVCNIEWGASCPCFVANSAVQFFTKGLSKTFERDLGHVPLPDIDCNKKRG